MPDWQAFVDRHAPGKRVRGHRPLAGGVSAHVELLLLEGEEAWVVRQQGSGSIELPTEFVLTRRLFEGGVEEVPEPLFLDASCTLLDRVCTVQRYTPGHSEETLTPTQLRRMGAWLADLHRRPIHDLPPLPLRVNPLAELDRDLSQGPARTRLLARLSGLRTPDAGQRRLLHGDFWAGNLLWEGPRLRGVVDWEDAAVGDPMADLAGARVELRWMMGPQASEVFTQAYCARRPSSLDRLPSWELYVSATALGNMGGWGLPPKRLRRMQESATAVLEAALTQLRC